MYLFLLSLLSFHVVWSSSSGLSIKDPRTSYQQAPHAHEIRRDFLNPPTTDFPVAPVTNPVTTPSTGVGPVVFPPATPTPTIITVPSTTSPSSNVNPPAVTNPVTDGSSGNAPSGQTWCVAVIGMPDSVVQAALDYACGIGGADCSAIQDGGNCYNPNTLQYHASYAFNTYYQRNPVQTSCVFGGVAVLTSMNPSSGSCIFAATSTSTYSPTTAVPTTESPITPISTSPGMPQPGILNPANPGGLGGYGQDPTIGNSSSGGLGGYGQDPTIGNSSSGRARPLVGGIITTSLLIATIILSIY